MRLCLPIPPPSISAWLNVGSLGHYSRGAARMAGPVALHSRGAAHMAGPAHLLGRAAAHRRPAPGPAQSAACGAGAEVKDVGTASPQSCPTPASHVRHPPSLPESRTHIVGSAAPAAVATPPPPATAAAAQGSTAIVGAAAGELKARPLHTVLPTRLWPTLGRWICMFGKSSSGLGFVPEIRWQPMDSLSPLPRIPSAASAYSWGSVEARFFPHAEGRWIWTVRGI